MEEEKEAIVYDRIMGDDYITIKGETDGSTKNYESRMIAENEIRYFLNCSVKQVDCRMEYRYRISSMRSLDQIMEKKPFTERDIIRLIDSLDQAVGQLENYLLSEEKILLDPRFIYVDIRQELGWETNKMAGNEGVQNTWEDDNTASHIRFCYYPEKKESFTQSVKTFLPYILKKTDHEDREAIILSYSLYQISLEDRITMEDLKKTLDSPVLRRAAKEEQREKGDPIYAEEKREEIPAVRPTGSKQRIENTDAAEAKGEWEKQMEGERRDDAADTESVDDVTAVKKKVYLKSSESGTGELAEGQRNNRERFRKETAERRPKELTSDNRKKLEKNRIRKDRKKSIRELIVPFLSAVLVFAWFGYHYMKGEFPWMENPELYTGIILLIIASNMVYVFGNTFQAVEEERKRKRRDSKSGTDQPVKNETEPKAVRNEINHMNHTEQEKKQRSQFGNKPRTVLKKETGKEEKEDHTYALLSCQPDRIPNIPVSHFPFVIGRKAGDCDFQIMDASIRKKHAKLDRDQQEIYVTDYSAGETFVDGHILEEMESISVMPGQEIRFSDFSFIWAEQKRL